MGCIVGCTVGILDGLDVGCRVGCLLGLDEGLPEGCVDGRELGRFVGCPLGCPVGKEVGRLVGGTLGTAVGNAVGSAEGGSVSLSNNETCAPASCRVSFRSTAPVQPACKHRSNSHEQSSAAHNIVTTARGAKSAKNNFNRNAMIGC